jgi:photosystem II stability/assembly factor-like uncharacterized protein
MSDKVYSSRRGAVFVQKTGPNSKAEVLRCLDADAVTSPKRDKELIKCWDAYGEGWIDVGKTYSPPGPATVTLTQLTEASMSELEKLYCPVTLLFAQVKSGKVTQINNAERVIIMKNAEPTEDSYDGLVHHSDDNVSTHAMPFSADSEITVVGYPDLQRQTTTLPEALNDIHGNLTADCPDRVEPGDYLIAVPDADGVGGTASVYYSRDGGITWTASAADPFAADENIAACQWLMKDNETERWLVGEEAPAAGQGDVAYSDDLGATWTTVTIGGAAAGHGPTLGGCLYVVDAEEIWLASAAGYIYKSEDGGESWTAKEQAGITAGDYAHIHFFDSDTGVAVAASGVVALTEDGGDTWVAGTPVTGTPDLLSCWMSEEETIWVGDDDGDLWYSHDFGTTWTERTGLAGTPGAINDVEFFDSQVGFIVVDTAAPVGSIHQTILGGYSWRALTTPTNSGINAIHVVNQNLAYMVGEANGGTAFIGKLSA